MKAENTPQIRATVKIPSLVDSAGAIQLEDLLRALPDIQRVKTEWRRHRIVICYDPTRTAYETIIQALQNTKFSPSDTGWGRLKVKWFRFIDSNARDNANAPPPACCNKPPK